MYPHPPASPDASLLVVEAFDQAPALICVTYGPEHVFGYVNVAYRQIVGTRELIGQTVRGAFPELEGQGFFELLDGVLASGAPYQGNEVSVLLERTPGAPLVERFVDFVYQPLFDPDGKPKGILTLGTDVTERVMAQRALDDARRVNDLILTQAPNLLCALDEHGYYVRMSEAARELLGYRPDEIVGRHFLDFVHPDDREATQQAEARVKAGVRIQSFENRQLHHNGSSVRVSWSAVWNPEERLILAVGRDVTAERAQETRLRESDERLSFALEAADVGAWDLDAASGSAWRSRHHDALFGYAEMLPAWTYELFIAHVLPEDRAHVQTAFDHALSTGTNWDFRCRIRRNDGEVRWIWAYGRPNTSGDGSARISGIVRDVTADEQAREERERLLAEVRSLNETLEARVEARTRELEEVNRSLEIRNRELQDFAYVASHDLQEPLRKIRSFAGMLSSTHAQNLNEEGQHFVTRMEAGAERMSHLIRDLLAFSRVSTQGAPHEAVDLNRHLKEVLGDLDEHLAETGGRVETAGPLPTFIADPVQMRQLLQNLIGNALKFRRPGVPPVIRISGRTVRGAVELTIEDNGIGFEGKYADRIFAPFQRLHAKHEYDGTGMGLAIVRRIVERHRGRITATSAPGEGARFDISLPQPI